MRVGSSLLWLRLAWQHKKAKVFCLLSHTDLLDPIRDHLSLKYNKNKVGIKQHLVSSCHSWAESQSMLQRNHLCKPSSSAPQRCELHSYNTIAINCMFNKKPGVAGTFWRAAIGVPATCKTSLAQERCKSHN